MIKVDDYFIGFIRSFLKHFHNNLLHFMITAVIL